MPDVAPAAALRSYREIATDFASWPQVWHTIDGRPLDFDETPGPPLWRCWMRLLETPDLADPFLDAARSVLWLDLMMWNAAVRPHLPWPPVYVAPNLDLAVTFHGSAAKEEWLLCDAAAPVGRQGLLGCNGRLWTGDGTLVASATSTLFCRPNAVVEEQRARRVAREDERRSAMVSM
jgi:acyl-CoA thioesterase